MYQNFFKLCGYDDNELIKESKRIDKAFNKAGLTPADVEKAERRVKDYYETEFPSMRKILGRWIKDFIDLVLAREERKKIVYCCLPGDSRLNLMLSCISDDVYAVTPERILLDTYGMMFDKYNVLLEAAEENGLPPGQAACSVNQFRLGAMVKGIIPLPDFTLSNGFFCDQTPKTDDLLYQLYGVPSVCIDGCMDEQWGEFPQVPDHVIKHHAQSITRAMRECEKLLGCQITEEVLHKVRVYIAKAWFALQPIWDLMTVEPQPISYNNVALVGRQIFVPHRQAIEDAPPIISQLIQETKYKIKEGKGIVPKGTPKVVYLGLTLDASIVKMVESIPLAIIGSAFYWISPTEKDTEAKKKWTTFEEKTAAAGINYGIHTGAWAQVKKMEWLCEGLKPDGVLNFYTPGCRASIAIPYPMKDYIEKKLGIPVVSVEMEICDLRSFSAEAIRTRVETFAQILKANIAKRGATARIS